MTALVLCVALVLIVSATCSITEASLYAVRMSFVRTLDDSHGLVGRVLGRLKENLSQPLVLDFRNLYEPDRMASKGFTYISVGRREGRPA